MLLSCFYHHLARRINKIQKLKVFSIRGNALLLYSLSFQCMPFGLLFYFPVNYYNFTNSHGNSFPDIQEHVNIYKN